MPQQRLKTTLILTVLLAAGAGSPAWADKAGTATDAGSPISDEQLRQFSLALTEIRDIRMDYAPRLQQADSREQQNRLKQQGRAEMLEAIRETGLEVNEYNRIGRRVGNDAALERRLRELMKQDNGG